MSFGGLYSFGICWSSVNTCGIRFLHLAFAVGNKVMKYGEKNKLSRQNL